MGMETSVWYNTQILVGFTDKRGKAWHYRQEDQAEEGNHYTGAIPVGDVLRRLFNWQAQSTPVAYLVPCGFDEMTGIDNDGNPYRLVIDPERQGILRSDSALPMGVFKAGYQPHQYDEWLIGTVANILDDDLSIGSAGLLKGGAQAWVQVEVPDNFTTPSGVAFRPNLLGYTSFDGSLATTFKRTQTIVVCDNTLEMARGEKGQTFKLKHTKNSGMKLENARQALDIVMGMADDFTAEVEQLTNTVVTDDQFRKIIAATFPTVFADSTARAKTMDATRRAELLNLWHNDARVTPWTNTGFGVVQAFNTWAHHVKAIRGTSSRFDRNMANALDGETASFDLTVRQAMDKVLATV